MYETPILTGYTIAGCDTPLMMRIKNRFSGQYTQPTELESINVKVAKYDAPETLTYESDLDVDTVTDDLSKVGWTHDNIGYNFRPVVPGNSMTIGDADYSVEFTIKYLDGYEDAVLWRLHVTAKRLG